MLIEKKQHRIYNLTSPFVSIILPAYNAENTIEKAISSCLDQNFSNFELIVIDDGSEDSTSNVVNRLITNDSRIRIINSENNGVSTARRKGIYAAKGIYLFFLDADDYLSTNSLEKLVDTAVNYDSDIVVGDIVIRKFNNSSNRREYNHFHNGTGFDFMQFILVNWLNYLWGKLIKRDLLMNNEIIFHKGLKVGEDQILLFQLCFYARKVVCVPDIVYNYVIQKVSATQGIDYQKYAINQVAYSLAILDIINAYEFSERIRKLLFLRIMVALHQATARVGSLKTINPYTRALLYESIMQVACSSEVLNNKILIHILKGIIALWSPGLLNYLFLFKRKFG